ncbi:hypothetical protein HLK59_41645 [Streptomyces sp. S3(2020)]|uniref:hypothetical protein n=1 Tax=Streptomyces sp. S3(2020) TaxID=2732044 RepID=UPI0014878DDF|nr:hypothetical protein [Streptomyces sp. S3(2020)]NNN36748.1 hypothetical protein [Streptomyces sp. S3(2020)]
MRNRTALAAVSAVTGALALTALAVPAAQAATTAGPAVTFSALKVNSGKNIVVGPTATVTVNATYTVTKPASLAASSFQTGPVLYRGTTLGVDSDDLVLGDDPGTCTASSSTVLKCTAKIQFRPKSSSEDTLANSQAGTWKLGALAADEKGGLTWQAGFGTTELQRKATLTANASPEPVKKGKTITVTGKLARANWETNKYAGYASQPVKLQFRKKGSTAYTTVKTIKSNSTGNLSTTVTASADGYYRYSFAGTTTTPAVSATGDYIDVQ